MMESVERLAQKDSLLKMENVMLVKITVRSVPMKTHVPSVVGCIILKMEIVLKPVDQDLMIMRQPNHVINVKF